MPFWAESRRPSLLLVVVTLLACSSPTSCGDDAAAPVDEGPFWLVSAEVQPDVVAADGSEAARLSVRVVDAQGEPAERDTRLLVIARHEASGEPTGTFGPTGESQMFLYVGGDGRVSTEFSCTESGRVALLVRLFTDEVGQTILDCASP